jgi:hypothetical protein
LLIGPPRSGTTLIANTFMSHSTVNGVIEPYQRRRADEYDCTDPLQLIADHDLDGTNPKTPHLAVKETTTRQVNVELSLTLLERAAQAGMYPALVLILRCPFAAFLSQVEASREMWRERKMTEASRKAFRQWMRSQQRGLKLISDRARAQHLRIVTYEGFCAAPGPETARLMALIPERLEQAQLRLRPLKGAAAGGDPKTRAKSGRIELTDRSADIAALIEEIGPCEEMRFAHALRDIVLKHAGQEPDPVTLDRLTRLLA